MPREFQPLLLRDLDISIEDYRISRLVINRHTPQVDRVSRHDHENFHQCLVYLKGRGYQLLPDRELAVRRGSLIFVPKNMRHGFRKERALRPLCLAIDFESETAATRWRIHSHLNPAALKQLEQGLVRLGQLHDSHADSLSVAGTILDLMGILRQSSTRPDKLEIQPSGPLATRIIEAIQDSSFETSTSLDIAIRLGFLSPIELNRKLRAEASPTVSRILTLEKISFAKDQLRTTSKPIGEIADSIGIFDQNYFARWFKTQTGQSPTEFRESEP